MEASADAMYTLNSISSAAIEMKQYYICNNVAFNVVLSSLAAIIIIGLCVSAQRSILFNSKQVDHNATK